jgi:hypothetical protein
MSSVFDLVIVIEAPSSKFEVPSGRNKYEPGL